MNRSLLIILTLSFISCRDISTDKANAHLPENSKTIQLQLIDSLGTITLSVPVRYDTSFSWTHYSDCGKPCDEQNYRFQPKTIPVFKESGFTWDEPKDSVERLTINHKSDIPFYEGDTAKDLGRSGRLKSQFLFYPDSLTVVLDTIQRINDRYYSIIAMEKSDTLQTYKMVLAATTIKGNEIKFQYLLRSAKYDSSAKHFIKNSIELLKTIRISKGI